jgi:hypothetical protein
VMLRGKGERMINSIRIPVDRHRQNKLARLRSACIDFDARVSGVQTTGQVVPGPRDPPR